MKRLLTIIPFAFTFLVMNNAFAQRLAPDFSVATDSTDYVCRFNAREEVELFRRSGQRDDAWAAADFNAELNEIRSRRDSWKRKFRSRKSKLGASSPRTRLAKKRWKGFRRTFNALASCGRSLTVSVSSDPCLEIAPEEEGEQSLLIMNGNRCRPVNSSVVELELVFSFSTGGCSGTVLNETTVLTAAHCLESKPREVLIYSGREVVKADGYIMHPDYNPFAIFDIESFDVAIIKTRKPLTVPTSNIISGSIATGEKIIIAGYGIDERGNSGTLRAVDLRLSFADSDTLATKFNQTNDGNTCFGDSGGPLFVHRGDEWVVAGITSNGDKNNCGRGDISRYTNVTSSAVRDFIIGNSQELSIN